MQTIKNIPSDIQAALSGFTHPGRLLATLMLVGALILSYLVRGGHDHQRAVQLAGFLVFSLAIVLMPQRQAALTGSKLTPLHWSLVAFFLLGAISSARAFSPRYAFYEVASFLMLLMFSLHVAGEIARDGARNISLVLKIYGLGCALYAFKVLVTYVSAMVIGVQPESGSFAPGFTNHRFLNHTQTITLPLLVLLAVSGKPADKTRWIWFSLAGLWWALLVVSAGRGSIIGLMAGSAVALVLRGRHAAPFLKAMLLTGLLGLAIYAVFFVLVPLSIGLGAFGDTTQVVGRSLADPASGRLSLWARAMELIVAHPWLGVGPLHFAHYGAHLQSGAHPHSWVLQIATEWGVPALLFLCLAAGSGLWRLLKTAAFIPAGDRVNQHMLAAWVVIGAAILADGLVSGLIVMPVSQLLIALYIACAAGWSMSLRPAAVRAVPASGVRNVLVKVLVAGALVGVANGVWGDIDRRIGDDVLTEQEAALNHTTSWSRIWTAGYF